MKKLKYVVFRDFESKRVRIIKLGLWLTSRCKIGCMLSFELPFGVVVRDEKGVYGTPLGIWTARRGRFAIFAINIFFVGFYVLTDKETN